eukprot:scaffold230_cov353-Prasinococcus_capsulatus_cf.AAC.9
MSLGFSGFQSLSLTAAPLPDLSFAANGPSSNWIAHSLLVPLAMLPSRVRTSCLVVARKSGWHCRRPTTKSTKASTSAPSSGTGCECSEVFWRRLAAPLLALLPFFAALPEDPLPLRLDMRAYAPATSAERIPGLR